MPAKRRGGRQPRRARAASDDDSSDDDETLVDAPRYALLGIPEALRHPLHRVCALDDLHACFEECYADRATKACQNVLFADLLAAVQAGCSTSKEQASLTQAIKAAERLLPPKKRSQLLSEFKRASVAHRRANRRPGSHGDNDSDGEEELSGFGELPLEVVEALMTRLNPVDIAACMCVSRLWRQLAGSCDSWPAWVADLEARLRRNRPPVRQGDSSALAQGGALQQQQQQQPRGPRLQLPAAGSKSIGAATLPMSGTEAIAPWEQPSAGASGCLAVPVTGASGSVQSAVGGGRAAHEAMVAGSTAAGLRADATGRVCGSVAASCQGPGVRQERSGSHLQFCRMVTGRPARLLHWTAQRWLSGDGQVFWHSYGDVREAGMPQLLHSRPLTSKQVVEWLCHDRVLTKEALSSSESDSSTDSSDDEDAGGLQGKGAMRFWSLSLAN